MSSEQDKAVVAEGFARMDQGDLTFLDELYQPDALIHFPGLPGPMDPQGIKPVWAGFLASFDGLQHEIVDSFVQDGKVALRLIIRGTHSADFQGLPPTGRTFQFEGIDIFHLSGGRVQEMWVQYDAMGMLQQLGAIPTPA